MASIARVHRRCTSILRKVQSSSGSSLPVAADVSYEKGFQSYGPTQKNAFQTFSTYSSMDNDRIHSQGKVTFDYNPEETQKKIIQASLWNQGKEKWDPQFCQDAVMSYTNHLQYLLDQKKSGAQIPESAVSTILSSKTTGRALKAMTKMNLETYLLSKQVRQVERLIGKIGLTPLTDRLSLSLLEANGKAGNVGRTLSLLNLRKVKGYRPIRKEFKLAIQAILSAGLYLRKNRNVFMQEDQQPEIDNPTRWLDAILVNMSERGVKLDTLMANQMLDCYCSTGRSGKAIHFFYKVTRQYIDENGKDAGAMKEGGGDIEINAGNLGGSSIPGEIVEQMPVFEDRKTKVRMRMRQHMPPYYKLPSDVKLNGELVKRPSKEELIPKLEWEKVRQSLARSLSLRYIHNLIVLSSTHCTSSGKRFFVKSDICICFCGLLNPWRMRARPHHIRFDKLEHSRKSMLLSRSYLESHGNLERNSAETRD